MPELIVVFLVTAAAAVAAGLYLLPTLIGWARHVPGTASIAVINILLGWTLAGWAVALAMALRSTTASAVQVINVGGPFQQGIGHPGQAPYEQSPPYLASPPAAPPPWPRRPPGEAPSLPPAPPHDPSGW